MVLARGVKDSGLANNMRTAARRQALGIAGKRKPAEQLTGGLRPSVMGNGEGLAMEELHLGF